MPGHGSNHPSPFWTSSACAASGKNVTSEPAGPYQNFRKGRYQNFRNPHLVESAMQGPKLSAEAVQALKAKLVGRWL